MIRKALEIVRKWRSESMELDGVTFYDVVLLDWCDMKNMVKEIIEMVAGSKANLVSLPNTQEITKFLTRYMPADTEKDAFDFAKIAAVDLEAWLRLGKRGIEEVKDEGET